MAKVKVRGGSSGKPRRGGHRLQRGGLKHRRKSKPVGVPGTDKASGAHKAAKAQQPTDRPMLGESTSPCLVAFDSLRFYASTLRMKGVLLVVKAQQDPPAEVMAYKALPS